MSMKLVRRAGRPLFVQFQGPTENPHGASLDLDRGVRRADLVIHGVGGVEPAQPAQAARDRRRRGRPAPCLPPGSLKQTVCGSDVLRGDGHGCLRSARAWHPRRYPRRTTAPAPPGADVHRLGERLAPLIDPGQVEAGDGSSRDPAPCGPRSADQVAVTLGSSSLVRIHADLEHEVLVLLCRFLEPVQVLALRGRPSDRGYPCSCGWGDSVFPGTAGTVGAAALDELRGAPPAWRSLPWDRTNATRRATEIPPVLPPAGRARAPGYDSGLRQGIASGSGVLPVSSGRTRCCSCQAGEAVVRGGSYIVTGNELRGQIQRWRSRGGHQIVGVVEARPAGRLEDDFAVFAVAGGDDAVCPRPRRSARPRP